MSDPDNIAEHIRRLMMQARAGAAGEGDAGSGRDDFAQAMALLARELGGGGGAGEGGGLSGSARGRARQAMAQVLRNISNQHDDSEQYQGLTELCNQLNMATEDVLAVIRPDTFVRPIAACLAKEYNPELQIVAARALTYMIDAIPTTALALSSTNAVDLLLDRLRTVTDVELSEQCLTCVEKIASEVSGAIVSRDGVAAILAYIDFFGLSVQRKAWNTVATLCRRIKAEQCDGVAPVLHQIHSAMTHEDTKIRECALVALYRLVLALRKDAQKVTDIMGDAGVTLVDIVSKGVSGDAACFPAALQLALAAVSYSPAVAASLIDIGFVAHLMALLEVPGSGVDHGGSAPRFSPSSTTEMSSPLSGTSLQPDTPVVASPSTLTPLRSTIRGEALGGSAARTPAHGQLSPEIQKQVCAILTSLLPRITTGYLPYLGALVSLHNGGHLSRHAALPVASEVNLDAMDGDDTVNRRAGSNGTEEEDAEHTDDAAQEDDEDEDDEETLRAELNELVEAGGWITFRTDERHRRCRSGTHSCDNCGASKLTANNWFRCNDCPDYDLCLSCAVHHGAIGHTAASQEGEESATPTAQHTFTDMSEFGAGVVEDPAAVATRHIIAEVVQQQATHNDDPRVSLFKESPYFIQRVIEALPAVVRLRLDSEHPRVQHYAFMYIARAVHHGTAEDLRRILADTNLCEAICSALCERELVYQVTAVAIASELIKKLPDVYIGVFLREGVVNALLNIKTSTQVAQRSEGGSNKEGSASSLDLQQLCATPTGWNRLLFQEASAVLAMFPSLTDSTRSAEWDTLCALLRDHGNPANYVDALQKLQHLMHDATTFEVMNCTLLHDLRSLFQTAEEPVKAVVDFVYALSAEEISAGGAVTAAGSVSLFTKFIRLLQSALSQLENFKQPKFATGGGIHAQLRLVIMPHNTSGYAAELAKRSSSKRRSGGTPSNSDGSAPSSPSSPGPNATPTTDGRGAQVGIEPLATIQSVAQFIQDNLLPNSRRAGASSASRERAEGEDDVDEVLPRPESASSRRQASPANAAPQPAPLPAVYLRCGRYAVPSTMSMLQILHKCVKHASSPANSASTSSTPSALETAQQPLMLHYSTTPWGSDVRPLLSEQALQSPKHATHGTNPQDPITFIAITDAVTTEGCTNIRNSIYAKFEESKKYLSPAIEDVLSLLGVFFNAVESWQCVQSWLDITGRSVEGVTAPNISLQEFINAKVNSKAMRHSAVPLLAGQHLSTWAVNLAVDCNFLFTPQTRRFLFEVSFFGTARSLVRMQEYIQENGGSAALELGGSNSSSQTRNRQHRLQRIKKRVWRDRCLECAVEVLNGQRGLGSAVMEFEYYNEEGSGLGPTLEFYTLVGDALRERKYGLWRANDESSDAEHYQSPAGLFPRPLPANHNDADTMKRYFRIIGRFLGRALLDKRIPNLRLSRPLIKILRGDVVSFDQFQYINEGIFQTMRNLATTAIAAQKQQKKEEQDELLAKKIATIEAMELTFTLPGADDVELVPGGAEKLVTVDNALEFINKVSEFVLKSGIEAAMVELRSGLHELVPLHALRILTVAELQTMIDGHTAPVTIEELERYCSADHGFTMSSGPVKWLFESIASMDIAMQRRFFQFLTGSPYLPVGGLAQLRPRLTIVRKTTTDPNVSEMDQLPSAMTCQNYLKLPAYESKEILDKKLRLAIEEGCGVFLFT